MKRARQIITHWVGVMIVASVALWHGSASAEMGRDEIEEIVRQYILDNPEILVEAMENLRERERLAEQERAHTAILAHYEALAFSDDDPIAGNPDGDVVIVEFFDYRCPYCKRVLDPLLQAVEQDGNVRLVFKEFPILGADSVVAARAALAARNQGKYLEFHTALMQTEGALTEANIFGIGESVGLDIERLREDMESDDVEATILSNYAQADQIGVGGTPAFIIGKEFVPGAIDIDRINRMIADARAKSG